MCMDIACLFTCAWTLPVCLHVHEHCLFVYMVIYVCTSDILSKCLLVCCSFPQCVRQASTYGAKRNLIVDGVKILITKVHDLVAVCFFFVFFFTDIMIIVQVHVHVAYTYFVPSELQ